MERKTDMKYSLPEIGSKNWAEASIEQQFSYNRASKSSRIEREEEQAHKYSSSIQKKHRTSNPNVDILKLHNDESDDNYDFDEDDEELSLLYSTDDELNQKKGQTKISFSTTDNVRVYCPDLTDKKRKRCSKPRRKTIDDNITVIGRTFLYKGRHSDRVTVMSRISDVSVESPLPTPRNVTSTPVSVPSTPRNVPSTPISVLSAPNNVPPTPKNVPPTQRNVPPTPALFCAKSYNVNSAASDTTSAKSNNNSTAISQNNSLICGKSPNTRSNAESISHSSKKRSGEKKLRSALPPVQKTISNYLPTINTRASQSVHFTREPSSVNVAKESQHFYKQLKVVNNTTSPKTKATSVTVYKPANNTTVKLPNINKPNSGRVSEKADRNQKSKIPVLPKIEGPSTKHRGRQGL